MSKCAERINDHHLWDVCTTVEASLAFWCSLYGLIHHRLVIRPLYSDADHVCFLQIRIVKNPNEKNSKKQHRGYAFIVYEREKDMKGTVFSPTHSLHLSRTCLSIVD
jgi:hypothetical protein